MEAITSSATVHSKIEIEKCPICDSVLFEYLFDLGGERFVRCESCELIMINPQPVFADIMSTYEEAYAVRYFRKKSKKLRRIKPWVRKIKNSYVLTGKWLDIGCSVGYVVYCAKNAGFDAYGVDVNPIGLEYAKKEFDLDNLYSGSVEDLDFPDGYFDVISLYDVIEHVPDPNPVIKAMKRLLAPGGVIDLRTPDSGHWRVPKDLTKWEGLCPDEHLFNFNLNNIEILLNKYGLKVVKKRFHLKSGLKVFIGHK